MTRNPIPSFASDHPERATKPNHFHLPFYCCNCTRKAETTYLTPNFGPFCDACIDELKTAWQPIADAVNPLITCPFCKESDFDDVGLKIHLSSAYCRAYEKVIPNAIRTLTADDDGIEGWRRG